MSLPNYLTLLRILLIPVVVMLFYLPVGWGPLAAAGVFTLASITDWLDGYLARKMQQITAFGAFLDPVADKLMVAIALVLLVEQHASWLLTLPATVIVGREIVISALREWMAELGKRTSVAVSYVGKLKTSMQMLAIIVLLANPISSPLTNMGIGLLYLAAILTLWSMVAYLRAAWPDLTADLRAS